MSAITYEFKASYAFIERNFNIVKRYWAWELVRFLRGLERYAKRTGKLHRNG